VSAPAATAAPPQPVSFAACDGRLLAGLLLAARSPRGALLVNGATGFRREFYLKFAA
jgi:predicted alpha/beta hydrolase